MSEDTNAVRAEVVENPAQPTMEELRTQLHELDVYKAWYEREAGPWRKNTYVARLQRDYERARRELRTLNEVIVRRNATIAHLRGAVQDGVRPDSVEPRIGGSVEVDSSSWPGGAPYVWLRVDSYAHAREHAAAVLAPAEARAIARDLMLLADHVDRQSVTAPAAGVRDTADPLRAVHATLTTAPLTEVLPPADETETGQ